MGSPYSPHLVRLDFACNDPDNGNFEGRAAMIQLPDGLMNLEAHDFRGPTFRVHADTIQISRRRFPYAKRKDWIGNWCWNAYWLDVADAVELLAYVHRLDLYACDMAEERLYSRWRWEDQLSADDREFLARQMVKADLAEQHA